MLKLLQRLIKRLIKRCFWFKSSMLRKALAILVCDLPFLIRLKTDPLFPHKFKVPQFPSSTVKDSLNSEDQIIKLSNYINNRKNEIIHRRSLLLSIII